MKITKSRFVRYGFILCLFSTTALWAAQGIKGDILVYFSPKGGCQGAIVKQVNEAKSEILVAMYALTEGDISWALVKARERGIDIKVVLDQAQRTQKYAKGRFLSKKGVPVRYENRSGLLHHKFAVIDNKIVITGSFNWTASAESRNNENLLIITSEELAQEYKREFRKLWEAGKDQTE
ncbi:phospholipase D family protein [bacterium]|nr:phospholipase D family protein [bacterium]